jgi:Novel toxin 16
MYDVYGINSPAGKYIPNDNLEYRDASPRNSDDGQISIRDANILKIKVTYAYDIDKIPLMATLLRRIMCSGFAEPSAIEAWSAQAAAYDASNCKYYLNKKLPIVAHATVQMQSNAIQLAGGTTPVTPVTPVNPVNPVTPVDPIACTAPQASPAASVQRATLQTYVTPEEYNAKLAQVPTPLLTMQTQTAIAMGAPVAVVLFCAANPLFCVGPAIIASCAATPACMDAAVRAGCAVLAAVVNACTPGVSAPTADSLTKAHKDAAGDKTKPGYGGQCTPDEHDDLKSKQEQACGEESKGKCSSGIDYTKADAILKCINARQNIARKCFLGGDDGHNKQINQLYKAYGQCMGRN